MKKTRLYLVLLFLSVLSLFFVKNIFSIFTKTTVPNINVLTVSQNTSYTVIHELMDLNGTTYTEYSHSNYPNVSIGTTISPNVLTIEGFDSPTIQTLTLNSYDNTIITYRYTRKQFNLTINNGSYVTTTTTSGTYYYGEQIHLVAAPTDNNGNPFIKWSNNITNLDYTFTITDNITIEPIYAQAYNITYQPNNGDSPIINNVAQNQPLGILPNVTYDDCEESSGDYHERGCTSVYKFEGWYTESTFENQVNENYIPTGDTTLYAKWNKIFFASNDPFTCTGSNYIDTGIMMFNQENADKDFIITFTVEQNNGYTGGDRGTIFANMNEVGEPYPGVHFFSNNNPNYTMNINTTGKKVKDNKTGYVTGQSVVIKKELGIIYYSYDGGQFKQINDFSNFNTYFNNTATFCAGTNSQGNKYRYFKGTVSDMSVELIDPQSYTIHYDPNGGTGMMLDQTIKIGNSVTIKENTFTNNDNTFSEWNTAPDGSGTSYSENYTVTSDLGNNGEVVTLYAQWTPPKYYYVHFDSNGGTGNMQDEPFVIGVSLKPLAQNTFTRENYEFRGWNTEPDGTGTHYDNLQEVKDLSTTEEEVVTLYAEWWKIQYIHTGDAIFDGTINTFIDTGVNIFSSTNIGKDFEIRFTFKSVDSDLFDISPTQPTMFNVKDESNSKLPGFNIRFNSSLAKMNSTHRWGGSTVTMPANGISTNNAPIYFIYKREEQKITMQYSYEGFTSEVYSLISQGSWDLNSPFATNVAFGGYFDSNNVPGRFFKGTLADMIILMDD